MTKCDPGKFILAHFEGAAAEARDAPKMDIAQRPKAGFTRAAHLPFRRCTNLADSVGFSTAHRPFGWLMACGAHRDWRAANVRRGLWRAADELGLDSSVLEHT